MNTNERFEIVPHAGAGSIKFGMTPEQVENAIGVTDTSIINDQDELVEFRSAMNITYSKAPQHRVCHIGFGRQMEEVMFGETPVFRVNPDLVIKKIMELDPEPYLFVGFIIFLKLGITLTGFHDDDIDNKALAVFEHNEYEEYIHAMKPFKKVMNEEFGKGY